LDRGGEFGGDGEKPKKKRRRGRGFGFLAVRVI